MTNEIIPPEIPLPQRELLDLIAKMGNAAEALTEFVIAYQVRFPPPPLPVLPKRATVTTPLNIRQTASKNGVWLGRLEKDDVVEIHGEPVAAEGLVWVAITPARDRWVSGQTLVYEAG